MKKILFAALAAACLCASAQAQTMSAYTVASCGNQTLVAGQSFPITMNLTGDLCSSGGGGGGGGAVTAIAGAYATGSIVDLGTTADAAWSGSGNATLISIEKGIYTVAKSPLTAQSGTGVDIGGVDQIGGPWSFNETQIGGATYALGQQLAANSAPVVLTAAQITTLTPPAGGATAANQILDACSGPKTNLLINTNSTSSIQLVALSGATKIYVCSLSLIAPAATTVAFTTGTGTACVTGNAGVIGSTTAGIANGMALTANGGLTLGNGLGTVAVGAASSELCMILGTSVYVAGNLTYVQQ